MKRFILFSILSLLIISTGSVFQSGGIFNEVVADTTGTRLERSVDGLLRMKIHNLYSTGVAGIWLVQDTTDTARITIDANGNLILNPDGEIDIPGNLDVDGTANIVTFAMTDNTAAKLLIGSGASYIPKALSGDGTIDANGVLSLSVSLADSASSTKKVLTNVSADFSAIPSNKTYIYSKDDGSNVELKVTFDNADTEVTKSIIDETTGWKALSQGVSWNQSADTYSRLGSLKGIATSVSAGDSMLPIQSDMRRCLLADDGTVNYYLDANNSMMKQYTTIPYSDSINYVNGDTIIVTGATFSTTADTGMWVHNVDSTYYAWITGICSDDTLILSDSIFIVGDSINQYNAILNGDDGQVMVEIPKFYDKHTLVGTVHSWYISKYDLPGFELNGVFWKDGAEVDYRYIGAFEGSMWDATSSAMVPAANIIDNMYAAGDKLCSVARYYPKTNETRAEFRAMATSRSSSYRQLDYYLHTAVQLLYLVEYADFNSQTMIGMGRSELSDGGWTAGSYIGICGLSLADGNGTNSVSLRTTLGYATDYMTYRGIENLYGNVWKMLDGITWDGRWTGSAAAQPVYVTNNSSYFQDAARVNMQHLCDASYIGATNGYISNIENVTGFIPSAVGATSSTKLCDNYWQYSEIGRNYWRLVWVGANSSDGSKVGLFSLGVYDDSGCSNARLSGRLTY